MNYRRQQGRSLEDVGSAVSRRRQRRPEGRAAGESRGPVLADAARCLGCHSENWAAAPRLQAGLGSRCAQGFGACPLPINQSLSAGHLCLWGPLRHLLPQPRPAATPSQSVGDSGAVLEWHTSPGACLPTPVPCSATSVLDPIWSPGGPARWPALSPQFRDSLTSHRQVASGRAGVHSAVCWAPEGTRRATLQMPPQPHGEESAGSPCRMPRCEGLAGAVWGTAPTSPGSTVRSAAITKLLSGAWPRPRNAVPQALGTNHPQGGGDTLLTSSAVSGVTREPTLC